VILVTFFTKVIHRRSTDATDKTGKKEEMSGNYHTPITPEIADLNEKGRARGSAF
jgi:hypothetical protein